MSSRETYGLKFGNMEQSGIGNREYKKITLCTKEVHEQSKVDRRQLDKYRASKRLIAMALKKLIIQKIKDNGIKISHYIQKIDTRIDDTKHIGNTKQDKNSTLCTKQVPEARL